MDASIRINNNVKQIEVNDNGEYISLRLGDADFTNSLVSLMHETKKTADDLTAQKLTDSPEDIKKTASEKWENISSALQTVWENVKRTAKEKFDNLKKNIAETWDGVKKGASEKWEAISSTLKTTWESVKKTAKEKFDGVKKEIGEAWDNIKKAVPEKWDKIKTSLKDSWDEIKEASEDKFEEVRQKIGDAWENVKEDIPEKWKDIKESIKSKWTDIVEDAKDWGSDLCKNISDGIDSGISWVRTAAGNVASKIGEYLHFSEPDIGPLSNFHTFMPDMLKLMAEGIYENEHLAVSAIKHVTGSMVDAMGPKAWKFQGISAIAKNMPGTLEAQIPPLSSFNIPNIARGAVIPSNILINAKQPSAPDVGGLSSRDVGAILSALNNIDAAIREGKVLAVDGTTFARVVHSSYERESRRIGIRLAERREQ